MHYVVTRTLVFRFTAKDWGDALISSKNPQKVLESTVEMVEEETGREEEIS